MHIALRGCRAAAVAAVMAVGLQGIGGLIAGPLAAADTVMAATTAVNVRSGPSTSTAILGVLSTGATITATGPSVNGWTPVKYAGKSAYVSTQYLRSTSSAGSSTSSSSTTTRTAIAIEAVNVRTGPGLTYPVSTVLPKGGMCWLNGVEQNGYSQLVDGRWVSTTWITKSGASSGSSGTSTDSSSSLPDVTGQVRATAALMIRTTSGSDFTNLGDVPSGTILDVTGVTTNGVAQIVYQGAVRWVNANYIVPVGSTGPAASTDGLPAVTGTRYATTALDIRNVSADAYTAITEVPKGTALQITGVIENGRMQIIYQGAVRWVTAIYLATTPVAATSGDSQGLDGLQPKTKAIVADCRSRFPQILTYYGVRSDPLPDHPSGRAVDIMLPNYRSNYDLGRSIADYYQANAIRFGIEYIIYDQHIWSVARSSEGWRFMADRGSDTANHKDHVHITVTA